MKTRVARTALAHRVGHHSLVANHDNLWNTNRLGAAAEPRPVRTTPMTQKRS